MNLEDTMQRFKEDNVDQVGVIYMELTMWFTWLDNYLLIMN